MIPSIIPPFTGDVRVPMSSIISAGKRRCLPMRFAGALNQISDGLFGARLNLYLLLPPLLLVLTPICQNKSALYKPSFEWGIAFPA